MSSDMSNFTIDSDLVFSLDTEEKVVRNISINTNDNITFEVPENLLTYSNMLSYALEDKDCNSIDLSLIDSKQFSCFLEFVKELDNNKGKFSKLPKPIIDTSLKTYLQEWEVNFIDNIYKNGMLAKLADASNYLDVQPLLDLVCAKIAALLKGKINSNEIDKIIESL
jgi:S-phase kinase-associated protein 1